MSYILPNKVFVMIWYCDEVEVITSIPNSHGELAGWESNREWPQQWALGDEQFAACLSNSGARPAEGTENGIF